MSNTNPKTRAAIKHYRNLLSPTQRMHFCLLPLHEQAAIASSVSAPNTADAHIDAAIDPDYAPPPSDHSPGPSSPSSSSHSTTTTAPPTPTTTPIPPAITLTCCTAPLATLRATLLAAERALAAFSARLSSLLLAAGDALDAAAFQQHHLAALPADAFAPRGGGEVRAWLKAFMADLGVYDDDEDDGRHPTRWILQRRCLELHLVRLEAALGRIARRVGRALGEVEGVVGPPVNGVVAGPMTTRCRGMRRRRRSAWREEEEGLDAGPDAAWWRRSLGGWLRTLHPALPGASPPLLPSPASSRRLRARNEEGDKYVGRRGSEVRRRLERHKRRERKKRSRQGDDVVEEMRDEQGAGVAHVLEHLEVVRKGLGKLKERMTFLREEYQIRAEDDEHEERYGRRGSEGVDGVERVFGRGVAQLEELRATWVAFAEEVGRVG